MKKLIRWELIFAHNDYMENVENLSIIEDNDIYKQFKECYIIEGLIFTHDSQKSCDIINRRFTEINSNVEKDGEVYIEGNFKELSNYIPLFNNLGYFISNLTIDGTEWTKLYNDDTKPLALLLEPKFDTKITTIPKELYHTTLLRNDVGIKKNGLIPRSNNKRSNHPDRIYLTDSYKTAFEFGVYLSKNNDEQPFSIYKVNFDNETTLYRDINLVNSGYYILGNISPKVIEKIYTSR